MIPHTMAAVLLTGHGGLDRLDYRTDVPVPRPRRGEVPIRVAAAGINNTDINTRTGWYSKAVGSATDAGGAAGFDTVTDVDATWSGEPLQFPRIQGADVCGRIVAVGEGVSGDRLGERVLVRNMLRAPVDYRPFESWTFGSEADGGFAQFTVAPAGDTYAVDSDWRDEELAAVPCAYSTAENMVQRAAVGPERVLVTGASGGYAVSGAIGGPLAELDLRTSTSTISRWWVARSRKIGSSKTSSAPSNATRCGRWSRAATRCGRSPEPKRRS